MGLLRGRPRVAARGERRLGNGRDERAGADGAAPFASADACGRFPSDVMIDANLTLIRIASLGKGGGKLDFRKACNRTRRCHGRGAWAFSPAML